LDRSAPLALAPSRILLPFLQRPHPSPPAVTLPPPLPSALPAGQPVHHAKPMNRPRPPPSAIGRSSPSPSPTRHSPSPPPIASWSSLARAPPRRRVPPRKRNTVSARGLLRPRAPDKTPCHPFAPAATTTSISPPANCISAAVVAACGCPRRGC